MNGMDFYEDLISWDPVAARRVVFLTGGAMTSKAAHFLEAVPNRCIEKAIRNAEFAGDGPRNSRSELASFPRQCTNFDNSRMYATW